MNRLSVRRTAIGVFIAIASPLLLILIWDAVTRFGLVERILLPSPWVIAGALRDVFVNGYAGCRDLLSHRSESLSRLSGFRSCGHCRNNHRARLHSAIHSVVRNRRSIEDPDHPLLRHAGHHAEHASRCGKLPSGQDTLQSRSVRAKTAGHRSMNISTSTKRLPQRRYSHSLCSTFSATSAPPNNQRRLSRRALCNPPSSYSAACPSGFRSNYLPAIKSKPVPYAPAFRRQGKFCLQDVRRR